MCHHLSLTSGTAVFDARNQALSDADDRESRFRSIGKIVQPELQLRKLASSTSKAAVVPTAGTHGVDTDANAAVNEIRSDATPYILLYW